MEISEGVADGQGENGEMSMLKEGVDRYSHVSSGSSIQRTTWRKHDDNTIPDHHHSTAQHSTS